MYRLDVFSGLTDSAAVGLALGKDRRAWNVDTLSPVTLVRVWVGPLPVVPSTVLGCQDSCKNGGHWKIVIASSQVDLWTK